VARDQQQHRETHEGVAVVGALLAVLGDLPADQVVGRRGFLAADELVHVRAQLVGRGADVLDGGLAGQQRPRPGLEELVVVVGHAELLADHQRRHGLRERLHQVGAAGLVREHRVEVLVDDLLDAGAQGGEPLDGELAQHRAPGRAVLGRVEGDQRRLEPAVLLDAAAGRVREVRVGAVRGERGVGEHRADVGVPGRGPHLLPGAQGHLRHRARVGDRRVPVERAGTRREGLRHSLDPQDLEETRPLVIDRSHAAALRPPSGRM
jgi:hypothetical protein